MAASHGIVVSPKDKNLGVLMSIVCSVYVCDECAARYVYDEIVVRTAARGGEGCIFYVLIGRPQHSLNF